MTTPTDLLRHYARQIALAAPKEWEAFVECFDAYSTDVTVAVTHATSEDVLVAQGRARAFLHLLKTFRECNRAAPQSSPTAPPQP